MEEFLRIVRRELAAVDARVLAQDEPPPETKPTDLRVELSGGRLLIVSFTEPPPHREASLRRVELLVDSFHTLLEPDRARAAPQRPPPARSLHEELRALAERAGAHDAIVIDARSPVVWGAALAPDDGEEKKDTTAIDRGSEGSALVSRGPRSGPVAGRGPAVAGVESPSVPRIHEVPAVKGALEGRAKALPKVRAAPAPPKLFIVRGGAAEQEATDSVSERALRAVRALPEMATLHRGGQLHHTSTEADLGFVARSFAGIYVLILAFPEAFDELRAKRAIVHALPVIEKLVLALPPQDPAPQMGGVVALRPRLRRRR